MVRHRPIGAVIADIYLNLGILPSHPLWREVRQAMFEFGGSLARLLNDIFDRTLGPIPSARSLSPAPHRPCNRRHLSAPARPDSWNHG